MSGIAVQLPPCDENEENADTIHIALRKTYIKTVLDIMGLGDNKCKRMPTPKSDEDEPRLGEEDQTAHHRCGGILRHLLRYRQDIASAVHEVSKTLGRFLLGTQKIMIRKSKHPEHLDAFTAPYQFAHSTKAGCECVARIVQGLTDLDADTTLLSVDGIGAFDLVSRAAMVRGFLEVEGGGSALLQTILWITFHILVG